MGDRLPPVHFTLLFAIAASLFFSRFFLTLSIILLFCATLSSLYIGRADPEKHKVPPKNRWYGSLWIWLPTAVFLWCLASFLYSADIAAAIGSVKVKVLFFILPFTLWHLRDISKGQLSLIMHGFVLICLLGSAWSLLQIPIRDIDLRAAYASGAVLPTPVHHIRFSLLAAFAASVCFFLAFRQPFERLLPRYAYLFIGLALVLYLHILAVRSGLIGLYLSFFFLLLLSFANRRKLGLKTAVLLLTTGLFTAAYWTVPTLRAKIDYTLWTMKIYSSGDRDITVYSDSRRLISFEAALHVIKDHPLTGVGIGDVRTEIQAFYREHYPRAEEDYIQPHNQYLWTATAIGIPGAIYLLLVNLALILRHIRIRNWILVAFNLIWVASFMVEDTLEMQIGVVAYLFFNYLGWHHPWAKREITA